MQEIWTAIQDWLELAITTGVFDRLIDCLTFCGIGIMNTLKELIDLMVV